MASFSLSHEIGTEELTYIIADCNLMWQSMRLEYFYKILWQFLVHDYSCIIRYEIILISQRVRHKYRLSQSGTSMTVTVNNIRRIKPKECKIYRVLPPFYTL